MSDSRGFAGHLATVIATAALAIAFMIYLLDLSGAISFSGDYNIRAVVPSAGSLTQGTSVTMAGIRVGTVTGVSRRGDGALVNLSISDHAVSPIPKNSTVTLRVRTPLGENYVEIVPGNSRQKLPAGGLVLMDQSSPYVDVDSILSTLQGGTRTEAEKLLQSMGIALNGRGNDLNETLASTAGLLSSGSDITRTIYPDRGEIAQLVRQLGDVTSAIGARQTSIENIADQGLTTLKAVAAQNAALKSFLDVLPSTLTQVRQTTSLLGSVSDSAAPVVSNLAGALTALRPAIRELGPASREGRTVVTAAASAAKPLESTLHAVTQASPELTSAIKPLTQVVCQLNPVLGYLKPYTEDLANFITGFGGAVNSYDAIGHTIRLLPVFDDSSAFSLSPTASAAAFALVHEGFLEQLNGLSLDPFPKPGQALTSVSGTQYGSVAAFKASGYRYPHILSDC